MNSGGDIPEVSGTWKYLIGRKTLRGRRYDDYGNQFERKPETIAYSKF